MAMRLREYALHADDAHMREYADADENLIHIYPHTEGKNYTGTGSNQVLEPLFGGHVLDRFEMLK